MNIQLLKYALEVEKAGSISRAAKNLYMNQPNLSKAIKELESSIGITLFERSTRGVSCSTEDGRIFLEYAKRIVDQFEDMQAHFRGDGARRHTFRIATPRAAYLTEAFARFATHFTEENAFNISIHETNTMSAIDDVIKNEYNLGIIRFRTCYERYFLSYLREKGLEYSEILSADSVIIMSRKNPLADKKVLQPADLREMIEITNDDFAAPYYLSAEKAAEARSYTSKRQILIYERESQFDLLECVPDSFMWVSPLPQEMLACNSLVQKACDIKETEFKDILIHKRGKKFGKLETLFLDCLDRAKPTAFAR